MSEDCIFCKIVAGEIPSDQLYRDEFVTAFRDISPQAPVHLLIVPNRHFNDFGEMGDEQAELMGRIAQVAGLCWLPRRASPPMAGASSPTSAPMAARKSSTPTFTCWGDAPSDRYWPAELNERASGWRPDAGRLASGAYFTTAIASPSSYGTTVLTSRSSRPNTRRNRRIPCTQSQSCFSGSTRLPHMRTLSPRITVPARL